MSIGRKSVAIGPMPDRSAVPIAAVLPLRPANASVPPNGVGQQLRAERPGAWPYVKLVLDRFHDVGRLEGARRPTAEPLGGDRSGAHSLPSGAIAS